LSAMQAVVDPLVAAEPKLGKVDAKNFISDRFLKKLEEEAQDYRVLFGFDAANLASSSFAFDSSSASATHSSVRVLNRL